MRLLPPDREYGWTPYAWLIYAIPFAVTPLIQNGSLRVWVINTVGLLAFLALYFRAHWLPGRRILIAVAGMTILGMIYTPWNPNAVAFFIYAACFIGWTAEASIAFPCLAALLLVFCLEAWLFQFPAGVWISGLVFSSMLCPVMLHYAQRAIANRKLRTAQNEIEHLAKIAERERIARDLHDLLGHTLSAVVLKSELASKLAERDPARAAGEIREIEAIARHALSEVRVAVEGYRSTGLVGEFTRAEKLLRDAGLEVHVAYCLDKLTIIQESTLSLVLREAVTNVIRHSAARSCSLRAEGMGEFLEVEIADDGVGGSGNEGSGLAGMRERLRAAGGTLQRDHNEGTRLLIRIPRHDALEGIA